MRGIVSVPVEVNSRPVKDFVDSGAQNAISELVLFKGLSWADAVCHQ